MKPLFNRLFILLAAATWLTGCDGRDSPPDSTTTGMQGGTAPSGVERFGDSSGQGAVVPQNLGTSPQPDDPPPGAPQN